MKPWMRAKVLQKVQNERQNFQLLSLRSENNGLGVRLDEKLQIIEFRQDYRSLALVWMLGISSRL